MPDERVVKPESLAPAEDIKKLKRNWTVTIKMC
jgi:hypothetical protein